ncbi:MAG: hypothetical protein IJ264_07620 [Clostridia bacterium]|nr:hypothetical protein [Clostridia bacterium]
MQIKDAAIQNEEIEIAKFVNFEINRFSTDFGRHQLELAKLIVNAGEEEKQKLNQERRLDIERKKAQRKLKTKK